MRGLEPLAPEPLAAEPRPKRPPRVLSLPLYSQPYTILQCRLHRGHLLLPATVGCTTGSPRPTSAQLLKGRGSRPLPYPRRACPLCHRANNSRLVTLGATFRRTSENSFFYDVRE